MRISKDIRYAFIDWRLKHIGGVNRSNLQRAFGVSAQQASTDLTSFAARFPDRMVYNMSAKRYEPKARNAVFTPMQHKTSADVAIFFGKASL